jgi:hypothetical protein
LLCFLLFLSSTINTTYLRFILQHAKTFPTGRHDDVFPSIIDGRETTFLVDAFRNGNIPDVRKWSQQAYDELARKRKDEARNKDFWYKPATWGLHDRLTMLLVVIFFIMKISAYVSQNRIGAPWLTLILRLLHWRLTLSSERPVFASGFG